jgi:hypothetical protein
MVQTFVQWKGTDLCMDFYCDCGHHSHVDGDFIYAVQCPVCDAIYEMPTDIPLKRVEHTEYEVHRPPLEVN